MKEFSQDINSYKVAAINTNIYPIQQTFGNSKRRNNHNVYFKSSFLEYTKQKNKKINI